MLASREFGWRLLGKLGVDARVRGSGRRLALALLRNAYTTVAKLDLMMLVSTGTA